MAWVVLRVVWGRVSRVLRFLSTSGAYAGDLAVKLGWSSRVVGPFAVTGSRLEEASMVHQRQRNLHVCMTDLEYSDSYIKAWAGVIKQCYDFQGAVIK